MSARVGDIVVGLVVLAVAGVFWVQRAYTSEFGGTFPDAIMAVLALLGLVLVILGVADRQTGVVEETERLPILAVARAVGILTAWVACLPLLGFLLDGIVFFFLTTLTMRTSRPTWRGLLLDAVVAVGVLGATYLVFTEVLYVRLPDGPF